MIETKRLILDQIKLEDKEGYFRCISSDSEVYKTFMVKRCNSIDELNFDNYPERPLFYSIKLRDTNEFIGCILLCEKIDEVSCEVGYALGSPYWGKGYMTEALNCFLEHLFSLGYLNIYASYFKGNTASKRVMEKCGMVFDHEIKNEFEYLGEMRDLTYLVKHKK